MVLFLPGYGGSKGLVCRSMGTCPALGFTVSGLVLKLKSKVLTELLLPLLSMRHGVSKLYCLELEEGKQAALYFLPSSMHRFLY